jgi:pimeloyl-ACP methyl ester carboxylesterase
MDEKRLVLLPGMDGTGRSLEPLARVLSPVVATTIVRYPASRPLSYDQLLPLVREACHGGGSFVLFGESFSGPLTLRIAAEQPAGLRAVILCASFERWPMSSLLKPFARWCPPILLQIVPQRVALRQLLGQDPPNEAVSLLLQALDEVPPTVMAQRARAIAGADVTAQLRQCRVPLLYLRAGNDRVVRPGNAARMQRIQPALQILDVEGPHLLPAAAPEAVARAITPFVQRHLG